MTKDLVIFDKKNNRFELFFDIDIRFRNFKELYLGFGFHKGLYIVSKNIFNFIEALTQVKEGYLLKVGDILTQLRFELQPLSLLGNLLNIVQNVRVFLLYIQD